jgi:hypothetical protein
LYVIFLLHEIWFLMLDLVLLLLCFQFLPSDSPPPPLAIETYPLTNKLYICTSNILALHYFPYPFFFKDSRNRAFVCCVPSCIL